MTGRSGASFARVEGRVLRMQADERLATMLRVAESAADGGVLSVPSRESVAAGDAIRVEVSFGAMADEIVLRGAVEGTTPRGDRAPLVVIRIAKVHAARVRYVHQVLTSGREATARSSRRVRADIQATWYWGLGSHATRLSDISKGGAFIRSGAPPSTGSELELELNDSMVQSDGAGSLRIEATVAWVGRNQGARGFGVKFRILDRIVASRIAALVRWHEREAGLVD
ncbi:PilZ domain protein [Enhygromyxa salina]|uniref:PilZ domain protein n=1 Tax=Enhygromyxa salina TaxID=215803 RepID=A0A2S9YGC0_9BACT|nr:PilZ domain-containing protein [Enhygromyxa salina]PRQ04154.1 PilZ domain protein [Enhygromyxa salina]